MLVSSNLPLGFTPVIAAANLADIAVNVEPPDVTEAEEELRKVFFAYKS